MKDRKPRYHRTRPHSECAGCRIGKKQRVIVTALIVLLFAMGAVHASDAWDPEAVMASCIREQYPWHDVKVSDVRLSAKTPDGPPISVTIDKAPPGRAAFTLAFADGRRISATALVKAFDPVVMSRSSLGKGHVLARDDVYTTVMETGRIPRGSVRNEDEIISRPLSRSIIPNMPITDAMVSQSPVVKRGRRVVLQVGNEHFSIRTAGEMKHDAAVGDYVKVLNLVSKKIVTGFLVSENMVRVEY